MAVDIVVRDDVAALRQARVGGLAADADTAARNALVPGDDVAARGIGKINVVAHRGLIFGGCRVLGDHAAVERIAGNDAVVAVEQANPAPAHSITANVLDDAAIGAGYQDAPTSRESVDRSPGAHRHVLDDELVMGDREARRIGVRARADEPCRVPPAVNALTVGG